MSKVVKLGIYMYGEVQVHVLIICRCNFLSCTYMHAFSPAACLTCGYIENYLELYTTTPNYTDPYNKISIYSIKPIETMLPSTSDLYNQSIFCVRDLF